MGLIQFNPQMWDYILVNHLGYSSSILTRVDGGTRRVLLAQYLHLSLFGIASQYLADFPNDSGFKRWHHYVIVVDFRRDKFRLGRGEPPLAPKHAVQILPFIFYKPIDLVIKPSILLVSLSYYSYHIHTQPLCTSN